MQVADLLAALAADITSTRAWVTELREELAEAEQKLTDCQLEAKAIENARSRYGPATPAPVLTGEGDPSRASLSRVDAVERALREAGPLHLNEIQRYLVQRGCEQSTIGAISATLTNLNHHRESVANVGKGRWDYTLARMDAPDPANPEPTPEPSPVVPVIELSEGEPAACFEA